MNKKEDSRYPYTHACDSIRMVAGRTENGSCRLNRAGASAVRKLIAEAIGMKDEYLAEKIADAELKRLGES